MTTPSMRWRRRRSMFRHSGRSSDRVGNRHSTSARVCEATPAMSLPAEPAPTVPAAAPAIRHRQCPERRRSFRRRVDGGIGCRPNWPHPLGDASGLSTGAGGLGGLGGMTGGIGGVVGSIVDSIGSLLGSLAGGLGDDSGAGPSPRPMPRCRRSAGGAMTPKGKTRTSQTLKNRPASMTSCPRSIRQSKIRPLTAESSAIRPRNKSIPAARCATDHRAVRTGGGTAC